MAVLRTLRDGVTDLDRRVEAGLHRVRRHRSLGVAAALTSRAVDVGIIVGISGLLILRPDRRRELLALGLCLGAEAVVVNYGLKNLVRRPRPGTHTGMTSSFPSGHTAVATSAALALAPGGMLWALWAIPVGGAVGYSRVHRGVHWLSDVAAGLAVGAVGGLAVRRALGVWG